MSIKTKGELLSAAYTEGIEVSLHSICSIMEQKFSEEIDQWMFISKFLTDHHLILVPSMQETVDSALVRLLKKADQSRTPIETVKKDLFGLESSSVEYKSSLFFDYNRHKAKPNTPIKDLKADFVTHSTLKTIAAFLNAGGGKLYIGVNDSGNPIGLEKDFPYTKEENHDSWMLSLNALIRDRFKDGVGVLEYVTPEMHEIDGVMICQVTVLKRTRPAYLKKKDGKYALYRRHTGETIELGIEDIEEFLISKGWTSP